MKKTDKVSLVADLKTRISNSNGFVLLDMSGMKVKEQEKLRKTLGGLGATLSVVKNTLLSRAIENKDISDSLSGQTALVVTEKDSLSPIQALGKFIKEFELPKLKVGIVDNNLYTTDGLLALSKIPSQEVLMQQLVGALSAPLYGVVGTLQGNLQKLVYILTQKGGE